MVRRSAISVFALATAFVLGMLLANRPATATAQPAGGRGKCVGVSAVQYGSNPGAYRVFRTFEDGTTEVAEVGSGVASSSWQKVGN
jgi:hypothetical protein